MKSNILRTAALWGWAALLFIPTARVAHGDWIQLHNGVQIHGEILRQDEDEVTLELTRGGVSSFDMRLIATVHRAKLETRTRLPIGDEVKPAEVLPAGLHPRPDAIRSVRRTVPGGTLLLPENATSEPIPNAAAPIQQPAVGTPDPDPALVKPVGGANVGAGDPTPPVRAGWPGVRRPDAIYRVDREEIFVRIGREPAAAHDEDQTDNLRALLKEHGPDKLHALELHRIAGLTTWIAERTTGPESARIRQVIGWVRLDANTVEVIEVEIPEPMFRHDPYRYRVIPRSYRPGTQGTAPKDPPVQAD